MDKIEVLEIFEDGVKTKIEADQIVIDYNPSFPVSNSQNNKHIYHISAVGNIIINDQIINDRDMLEIVSYNLTSYRKWKTEDK